MKRSVDAGKPFYLYHNHSLMHFPMEVRPEFKGKSTNGNWGDSLLMLDHDFGSILDYLKELGIEDNTIVVYTTDNGPMTATWPDAGFTPFRGEKNTGWEGGFRVPAMVKWPGHIQPGTVLNDIFGSNDWFPTLIAAAGEPEIKEKLLKGYKTSAMTYKVHLDGYNQLDYLQGKSPSQRQEFFYWSDDGDLLAMRYGPFPGLAGAAVLPPVR